MATYGRYVANAPQSAILENFFNFDGSSFGLWDSPNQNLLEDLQEFHNTNKNVFTVNEIISACAEKYHMEYDDAKKKYISFSFQHVFMDTDSSDYAIRTYMLNTVGFALSEDTIFVFDGENSHLENMRVLPYDDNFDFTGSWTSNLGNMVLESIIDPEKIGAKTIIQFTDTSKNSITPITFNAEQYQEGKDAFEDKYTYIINPLATEDKIMGIVNILQNRGILYSDIHFGTNSSETLNLNTEDAIEAGLNTLVGGAGEDTLIGNNKDNHLYGGEDKDILEGRGGSDTYYIFPNEGSDIIIDTSGDADTIHFGKDITIEDLTATANKDSNDLIISIDSKGTMVTLQNWYTKENRIEHFVVNGETYSEQDFINLLKISICNNKQDTPSVQNNQIFISQKISNFKKSINFKTYYSF
jgi:hypothetical protein